MSAARATTACAEVNAAWGDDSLWANKLALDRELATRHQTTEQRAITATIEQRVGEAGALALALTGSTARARRTLISDLDYHVVGPRPELGGLPGDVDIYARGEDHFWCKLRDGDDFVQWTLRFGCVLFDTGIFRAGLAMIAREGLWPDGKAKLARVPELRRGACQAR